MNEKNLGPCCCCETTKNVNHIIMVDKKSPVTGRGWGCVVCELACDGATYVLCDGCFNNNRKPKFACRGFPATDGRIPYGDLKGRHEHNMEKHKAYEERLNAMRKSEDEI